MSGDGYVRLTARGPVVGPTRPVGPLGMLFVDVEPQVFAMGGFSALRDLSHEFVRDADWLVARAGAERLPRRRFERTIPPALREVLDRQRSRRIPAPSQAEPSPALRELRRQAERIGVRARVAMLHQPLGEPSWLEGDVPGDEHLVARARAVELEALLEFAHAVWRPTDYHYRLPSGEHAASFIRLASAVREPRDAEVLASWLHPHLRDGVGFVLDTGTLTAVVEAAIAAMAVAGTAPGAVSVLDNYPMTDYDVSRAVGPASRQNAVIALLSVNSSGNVLDRLIHALASAPGGTTVQIVIDKHEVETTHRTHRGVNVDVWHPLPGSAPIARAGPRDRDSCALCSDQQRAPIVPISPSTYEATIKAAVRTITPSVTDPTANRTLWELCDRFDGVAIECPPPPELEAYRPPGPMALRINIAEMMRESEFRQGARRALEASLARQGREDVAGKLANDVLLVPRRELERDGMTELIEELGPVLGEPSAIHAFPIDERWNEDIRRAVAEAESLAVLSLGSVTGTTLYQALAESQALRKPGELLNGIVLHPRMAEQRAWEALENAYGYRLYCAWHSFLRPRSPIREEANTLNAFASDPKFTTLEGDARSFFEMRRTFCSNVQPGEHGLFWGSMPSDHLTPNSLYGQELRGPAVYAAVASAMERSRKGTLARAEPERRVFEVDAIVRSYYDPMILSAMMRWVEPHEAWWGWNVDDGRTTVLQMLGRLNEEPQLAVITSELLLAAAQGKLPAPAIGELRAMAEALLSRMGPDRRPAVELGLAMAPMRRTQDDQRAFDRWQERLSSIM